MYKFKILFIIFVSLLLFSCNQSVNSLNENQNTPKYNSKADKTIVRTFLIKWKLVNNRLTKLPIEKKEEASKKCDGKKLVLIKIDTDENNLAIGTFKCID